MCCSVPYGTAVDAVLFHLSTVTELHTKWMIDSIRPIYASGFSREYIYILLAIAHVRAGKTETGKP
jgi:hypothetical protein